MYIGGPEHATLHLMYARFFVKALRDMGLLDFDEPFARLYHQGMVLGPDGQKMSKSRGNVIAPDDVVGRYGADTVRCYLMFMGPFDQGGPWSNQGIEGVARFMNRVWTLVTDATEAGVRDDAQAKPAGAALGVERLRHKAIARVTADYEGLRFNTALAALMEYVNALNKARDEAPEIVKDAAFSRAVDTLLVLLAPMAPHLTEELWHERRLRAGTAEAKYIEHSRPAVARVRSRADRGRDGDHRRAGERQGARQAGAGARYGRGRGARAGAGEREGAVGDGGPRAEEVHLRAGTAGQRRGIALSMKIAPVASRHVVRRIAWLIRPMWRATPLPGPTAAVASARVRSARGGWQ